MDIKITLEEADLKKVQQDVLRREDKEQGSEERSDVS